jgi:phage major head subunit gpT-like protein
MPAITPKWMMGFQSRLEHIANEDYLAAASDLWYTDVAKIVPVTTGHTILTWLLNTAQIERSGKWGGKVNYRDLISQKLEFDVGAAQDGFKLHRYQIEDTDSGPAAVQLAAERSAEWGQWMAYWPQTETYRAIIEGNTDAFLTYDGLPMFHGSHPINPARSGSATFSNRWTTGSGPGLLPIHSSGSGSVTREVAMQNIGKAIAYQKAIKASNGISPRRLKLKGIVVGPALATDAILATQSKTIASVAGTAAAQGGSADAEPMIKYIGIGRPIIADELTDAQFDTDYILLWEAPGSRRLGPFVYAEREAFKMTQYGPMDQRELGLIQNFEWQLQGRNALIAGHPYLATYCKGVA